MTEYLILTLIIATCLLLITGFPIAFTLAGSALISAGLGILTGHFDASLLLAIPGRIFGIMQNEILIAVCLFIFMGTVLEKARLAEDLIKNICLLVKGSHTGLGCSIVLIGALLAASTGIVGATVVTLGIIALPMMIKEGMDKKLACGISAATGTLGQLIPPSIALMLLADSMNNSYQQAQISSGQFNQSSLSISDLFIATIIPSFILVTLYIVYIFFRTRHQKRQPTLQTVALKEILKNIIPSLLLVLTVLGSIISGIATPTEASGVGALGALILATNRNGLEVQTIVYSCKKTLLYTSMIFAILIGSSIFSMVFRGLGGEALIENFFASLGFGLTGLVITIMLIIFVLGFILDFIEIIYIVVPILCPVVLIMGADPLWLSILIALNLQTSFLTPPFGFSLFYLKSVAPPSITTGDIYKGVMPFIVIQVILLALIIIFPQIALFFSSL